MKNAKIFKVLEDTLLLDFLLKCYPNKSRNYVKSMLRRGQIKADGKTVKQFDTKLKTGQTVEAEKSVSNQIKLPFPIVYEDDDFIVIDKPEGMLTVSTDKEKEQTAYLLLKEYNQKRVFAVHRLDRETSGILLFAKDEKLKFALQENWSGFAVQRGYSAVIEGKTSEPSGEIKSWLKQTKTLLVYSAKNGAKDAGCKEAITNYETVKSGRDYSLMNIALKTGRKNQIRVHMKDIGHPVAGDKKYGAKTDPLKRLCLHANLLAVRHPYTGKELRFEAEMPRNFEEIIR